MKTFIACRSTIVSLCFFLTAVTMPAATYEFNTLNDWGGTSVITISQSAYDNGFGTWADFESWEVHSLLYLDNVIRSTDPGVSISGSFTLSPDKQRLTFAPSTPLYVIDGDPNYWFRAYSQPTPEDPWNQYAYAQGWDVTHSGGSFWHHETHGDWVKVSDPPNAAIVLNDGDILVANFSGNSLLRIDPLTGAQEELGVFGRPTDVALSPNRDSIYVAMTGFDGNGFGIERLDLATGSISILSSGGYFSGRNVWGIVVSASGDLYAAVESGNIVRVNPLYGVQELIGTLPPSPPPVPFPGTIGIDARADGTLVVSLVDSLWEMNPTTGEPNLLFNTGRENRGLVVGPGDSVLFGTYNLLKQLQNGVVDTIASVPAGDLFFGVELDSESSIVASTYSGNRIVRVDLASGAVQTVSSGGLLNTPAGVEVFRAPMPGSCDHAPSVECGEPYAVDEGGEVLVAATGSDLDGDSLIFEWDLDGDGTFETSTGETNSAIVSAASLDGPATLVLRVRVTDPCGLQSTAEANLVVQNVAPVVGAVVAPLDPVLANTVVAVSVPFSDTGLWDTHAAFVDWGDSTPQELTVNETPGVGEAAGTHVYPTPGVYTLSIAVLDDDHAEDANGNVIVNGFGESVFRYLVVYDPDGGFVTGGGWITSPVGAYALDPGLTGKANFGFVSNYKHGASVPTGETQFSFKVADLNFHSEVYEWLVVAGPKAQFKGTGTINGQPGFGFILTAQDGQVNGGGGIDKFRIKIWAVDSGIVVYDNQMNAADDSDPTTAIGGGSIVIHND